MPGRSTCQTCTGVLEALDFDRPEIAALEEISDQPARAGVNEDAVGLSQGLQAGGQVGRFADDVALPAVAASQQIADHHEPGRYPDAGLQPFPPDRQFWHRVDYGQAGPQRHLRLVLVSLRIAEIDQHAVAHEAGDKPVERPHRGGDAVVVGRDHLAQIFRVEPRGKRRRPHQIAEHHRQLPALRVLDPRCEIPDGRRRWRGIRERFEQPLAMAQQDAELFEIALRQLRQDFQIDRVGLENLAVFAKPYLLQPGRDVHLVIPLYLGRVLINRSA